MASNDIDVTVNSKYITDSVSLTVKIDGFHLARVRLFLSSLLARMAGWVGGHKVSVIYLMTSGFPRESMSEKDILLSFLDSQKIFVEMNDISRVYVNQEMEMVEVTKDVDMARSYKPTGKVTASFSYT